MVGIVDQAVHSYGIFRVTCWIYRHLPSVLQFTNRITYLQEVGNNMERLKLRKYVCIADDRL